MNIFNNNNNNNNVHNKTNQMPPQSIEEMQQQQQQQQLHYDDYGSTSTMNAATAGTSSTDASTTTTMIKIIAPCDMEEGYTFIANIQEDGDTRIVSSILETPNLTSTSMKTTTVTVPPGGVRKGQTFWVHPNAASYQNDDTNSNNNKNNNNNNSINNSNLEYYDDNELNRNRSYEKYDNNENDENDDEEYLAFWKDGLFDCFKYGFCHPTVINSLCCPQLLMGQILTRMNMTWIGNKIIDNDTTTSAEQYEDNIYFTPSDKGKHRRNRMKQIKNPAWWTRQTAFVQIIIIVSLYWIVTTVLYPPKLFIINDNNTTPHDIIIVPPLLKPLTTNTTTVTTTVGQTPSGIEPIGARPIDLAELSKKEKKKHKKDDKDDKDDHSKKYEHLRKYLYHTCTWTFGIYTLIVMTRLRRAVRVRYSIPSRAAFDGCIEDVCMIFWCGCCSVTQMARQTYQYDNSNDNDNTYKATFCTSTGLSMNQQQYNHLFLLEQQQLQLEYQNNNNNNNNKNDVVVVGAHTVYSESDQLLNQRKNATKQQPSRNGRSPPNVELATSSSSSSSSTKKNIVLNV